ncbi:MAG: Holliday junction branch migration protein RuvA [Candidatus Delongbacteria bacterium]|nr:Holliday junction branch migration protein RuvA [Candidatus Delongbacteria bacterium]MCG2760244.1 Holliday junction branch migration protein RuvA [Candidatus Delongbacteria bacterium]
MIEMLIGEILYKYPGKVIINCGGIGFSVNISSFTYSSLAEIGKGQTLHTVFKVREDDMSLYGFIDKKEKQLFLILSSVSGIGSKTAIQLLSEIKYDRLYNAIATADVTLISQAHGIGKKTAQKIVFELKDKIGKFDDMTAMNLAMGLAGDNTEAVTALVRLGYKNSDANYAVARIIKEKGKDISTQEIIKLVLQDRMKK